MKERGERQGKGGDRKSKSLNDTLISPPKLSDLGITKSQSSRWQKEAALSPRSWELRNSRPDPAKNTIAATSLATKYSSHLPLAEIRHANFLKAPKDDGCGFYRFIPARIVFPAHCQNSLSPRPR
jgi:hypothetical protein